MTESPKPYPEFIVASRHLNPEYQAERTSRVWQELRLHPPQLIAIINDSIQYVIDDEHQIVGFEVSDGGQDRIDAAIDINQEFPHSRLLTLSTSFDNILEYLPDANLYQMTIIMTGRVPIDNFILPQSRTYDTFTELIEIANTARTSLWGNFDNIAVVTSRKQAERISVMLDTLRSADDPKERERLDRYFDVYMPQRLTTISDTKVHEAFDRYKTIAYRDLLPNTALLRRKNFTVLSSEDITGTNLGEDEEHDTNLRGVQDWLDGIYGHEYMQPQESNVNLVLIVTRRASDPTEIPRIHIPLAGTAEAKKKGIGWGLTTDLP